MSFHGSQADTRNHSILYITLFLTVILFWISNAYTPNIITIKHVKPLFSSRDQEQYQINMTKKNKKMYYPINFFGM